MKLYCNSPTSIPNAVARIAMDMAGQSAEIVVADAEFRKTPAYKALTTTDKFPLLVTEHGNLHESTAIAKYFCTLGGNKHMGTNAVERTQIDQWISFNNTTVFPSVLTVCQAIFGWAEVNKAAYDDANKALKAHVKTLNTHLEGKKWLVGAEHSVADMIVSQYLSYAFQTVLDGGFRKAMKNVNDWAVRCYAHESVIKVLGQIQMCAKPLKPTLAVEVKVEKKKEVVQQVKKVVEEKKKDNVESLPPSSFDIYDFKTFYINHPDKKGAGIDETYKMLDWEGFSFWFLHYEKYKSEGKLLHVTNNLLGGFLSRAEHTTRYTFGRHCVLGEEPDLEIMGVWLMRGTELPDGLVKEHPQFEYYKSRKMDPRNNADDDKLVREFFGGKEGDMLNGLMGQTLKWHK
jgi:elongation factor 1-gamma